VPAGFNYGTYVSVQMWAGNVVKRSRYFGIGEEVCEKWGEGQQVSISVRIAVYKDGTAGSNGPRFTATAPSKNKVYAALP